MLFWHSIQREDFSFALTQAKSFDRRFNEDGTRVFDLASLAMSNEDYGVAAEAYSYLVSKGTLYPYYYSGKIGYLQARFLEITGSLDYTDDDLNKLEKEYVQVLQELGNSPSSLPLRRDYAKLRRAYYFHDLPMAIEYT